ncbi:thermonuclease family protein [Candidatus Mycoplasma mahonii]|uniref:thermonuclease family protein n=1 Tax=Candidatus Mycoplasma mahonii TaxID=3004105 RepID=UPI0026F3473E|nr:thermonuclease family protein [Candidatus Mycoplasma mahonii]WKX02488.1 thermonuclease family protein [Candidatus Mycoplasma mahonii]
MKLLFRIALLIMPFSLLGCSNKQSNDHLKIISVHDGDTFTDEHKTIYRLFGVDTPEVSDQYHNFEPTTGIEALYAYEATILAKSLILNKVTSIDTITIGKFGRTIAQVSFNNKDLAIELLKVGLARVAYISVDQKNPYFTNRHEYYKQLLDAQYHAAKNKLGFWRWPDRYKEIFPKSA